MAGNWKMNNNLPQSIDLAEEIVAQSASQNSNTTIILIPPFTSLHEVSKIISGKNNFYLGAQNVYPQPNGAFTGEISAKQLISVGVEYVLVGHSERRAYFNEDEKFLAQKVNALLQANLKPIFCCGETLEFRNKNEQESFVENQLAQSLFQLDAMQILNCVIAYEPVWAIGTGLNATSAQAQAMHFFIRRLISKKYSETISQQISILYGGSCKPDNAAELFAQPDVDGGLIGGASLKANDFISIINSI